MSNFSQETDSARHKNIEKVSKVKNPLEFLKNDLKYTAPNGKSYTLECCTKADTNAKILKWAFKLTERNVGPQYKQLKMGWQPKIKQTELNKNWARYLVAFDEQRNPVGFSMFRFDFDYGFSVLYCYELQIEPSHCRLGLGKYLMDCLEKCAKYWQMNKVVLTVLQNNADGLAFFKAIGYVLDESSPEEDEEAEYKIMSKLI